MTHLDICTIEARLARVEARLDKLEARARKPACAAGQPAPIDYEKLRAIDKAITDAEMRGDWDERERLEKKWAALAGRKDDDE
jgi:hypothetical protein